MLNVTFDRRHEIMKPCLTKISKITHFYQVVQNEKVTKNEGKERKKKRKKDFRQKKIIFISVKYNIKRLSDRSVSVLNWKLLQSN